MKTNDSFSDRGSALLAVLFSVLLTMALLATIFSITNTQVSVTRRTAARAAATTYADGVIESLFDQWRNAMITVTDATDRASGMSNQSLAGVLAVPATATLPLPPGATLGSWSVTSATPLLAPLSGSTVRPTPENGSSSSLRMRLNYLATVTVNYSAGGVNDSVTLRRTFVRTGRNVFDNFFFGTQPNIEFHPGAPMYVSGTAYVGGNLFTAQNNLHFTKDVSFTGSHTLDYRTQDSRFGVTAPDITSGGVTDNWDVNNPPHYGAQQKLLDASTTSLDPNFLDDPNTNDADSDGNPNNDGYHEMIEEQMPVTGTSPDPLQLDSATSERLSQNADYRIYVDALNNVSVYKGLSATPLAATNSEAIAIKGAISTNTALKDIREGDNVRLVTLDVSRIKTAFDSASISDNVGGSDGLLFYIKDTSVGTSVSTSVVNSSTSATTAVTSLKQRGVKIVKGTLLPSAGLSIVSPNTVYLQGDYNTGTSGATQPASNTATSYTPPLDNPSPVVPGYDRRPAVVVGDAVNILSNSWNDANSLLPKASRVAIATTFNTAIVAGNVPTTTASYSGGIENFTRLHEDWAGKYLTLYGSFALLFDSEQATGRWSAADYGAPNRRWYYDTLLQDKNPPGFRVARTYERGSWTRR